ncbi:probable diacetyl reductase [(S)-acetoin forming] [Coccomyxa sp. Obi]|nr:probable diacetyl reductase [(S)-acetoin forming] [Coccomyxa sp. Obi]
MEISRQSPKPLVHTPRSAQVCCASLRQTPQKTALITGGTRGIGYAIAKSLARDGYKGLVLGYNSDAKAAEHAQQQLQDQYGATVFCVKGDVAQREVLQEMFGLLREHFENQCTAFVHNAGLLAGFSSMSEFEGAPTLERTDTEKLLNPLDAELDSVEKNFEYYWRVYTLCFQLGLKQAMECEGLRHVIGISAPGCNLSQSPRLWFDDRGQGKAGMEFLVRVAAKAYTKRGINFNAIIPGNVLAGGTILAYESGEEMKSYYDKRLETTTGRWVDAEEIGDVVSFLCSQQGSAINGLSIPVDNGLHLFGG